MKLLAAVLVGLMACAIAIVVVPIVLLSPACGRTFTSAPTQQAGSRSLPQSSGGQTPLSPTAEQRQNAAAIISEVKREGLAQQAAVIAIATGLQESGLRNLPNGDRDSVGLFQQRPSQGWGSAQQIQNPAYATQQFLVHLKSTANWESLPLGQAAVRAQLNLGAATSLYSRWQQAAQQLVDDLWNGTSGQPSPSTAGIGQLSSQQLGSCSTPQFASSLQVANSALQGLLPWQVVSPIPNPGWRQQIPVPRWPADLPGTRANPPAITPQCVAGALWTWAAAHLQDPSFAHPPALTSDYASQMAGEARQKGFQVTSSPQPGDMVVWTAGSYYGFAGHVGTVIATAVDRYEVIEQNLLNDTQDMSAHWGVFDVRSVAWPDPQVAGFIHAPPGATTQQGRL